MEGLRSGFPGMPGSTYPSPAWSQQRRQQRRRRRRRWRRRRRRRRRWLRGPRSPRLGDAGFRRSLLSHPGIRWLLQRAPGFAGVAAPARPLSPPHAPTSTPSRGPGRAAWLHPGPRRGGGAPREARVGREGWTPPHPHRSPLPSVRCPALGLARGASELWVPLTVRPLCACAVVASSAQAVCVWRYSLLPVTEKWQLPKRGSSLLRCCGQAGLACLRR